MLIVVILKNNHHEASPPSTPTDGTRCRCRSNVSAASVDRSLRGVGVVNEEFDTSEEQQLQLHVVAAVDGLKEERQLGKPDKSGGGSDGGSGGGGGGGGGKGKNKEAAATTTEPTAQSASTAAAESATTAAATTKPPSAPVCEVNGVCYEEGSSCTDGNTESCCGQTYDSFVCTCENINGELQYMCFNTDVCMVPSCCMSGPPAGSVPSEGYCNVGEMCDTGVTGDYCCYDTTGGTNGSYCSETGGEPVRLR